jgi:hypothetical protein
MGGIRTNQTAAQGPMHGGRRAAVLGLVCSMALVAMLGGGCGPSGPRVQYVAGTVILDGSPLAAATVIFRPKSGGSPGAGITDAQGRYVLATPGFKPGSGVLAGDYGVLIRKYTSVEESLGPSPSDPLAMAEWQAKANALEAQWATAGGPPALAPVRYASDATSGLSATVVAGRNTLDFSLVGSQAAQSLRK